MVGEIHTAKYHCPNCGMKVSSKTLEVPGFDYIVEVLRRGPNGQVLPGEQLSADKVYPEAMAERFERIAYWLRNGAWPPDEGFSATYEVPITFDLDAARSQEARAKIVRAMERDGKEQERRARKAVEKARRDAEREAKKKAEKEAKERERKLRALERQRQGPGVRPEDKRARPGPPMPY